MGFFKKKKEEEFVDLTNIRKNYRRNTTKDKKTENSGKNNESGKSGYVNFPFLGFGGDNQTNHETGTQKPSENIPDETERDSEEKKRKITKRLSDMTNKIEELSNDIYKLQQRIEVLERKSGVWGASTGDYSVF